MENCVTIVWHVDEKISVFMVGKEGGSNVIQKGFDKEKRGNGENIQWGKRGCGNMDYSFRNMSLVNSKTHIILFVLCLQKG